MFLMGFLGFVSDDLLLFAFVIRKKCKLSLGNFGNWRCQEAKTSVLNCLFAFQNSIRHTEQTLSTGLKFTVPLTPAPQQKVVELGWTHKLATSIIISMFQCNMTKKEICSDWLKWAK